ncbi:Cysteine protease [Mycena venus]|uniref:Cysteine protease n=1 Tax=Mycena venus TaxID=2733690 RepID=A0A8H6YHL3_9AGAR|nr:Cysteine protease [Mycena venus]
MVASRATGGTKGRSSDAGRVYAPDEREFIGDGVWEPPPTRLTCAVSITNARLLSWFSDSPAAPFGVHPIALAGKAAGKDTRMCGDAFRRPSSRLIAVDTQSTAILCAAGAPRPRVLAAGALPFLDTYETLFHTGSRRQPLPLGAHSTSLLSSSLLGWPVLLLADIDHGGNPVLLRPRHKLVAFLGPVFSSPLPALRAMRIRTLSADGHAVHLEACTSLPTSSSDHGSECTQTRRRARSSSAPLGAAEAVSEALSAFRHCPDHPPRGRGEKCGHGITTQLGRPPSVSTTLPRWSTASRCLPPPCRAWRIATADVVGYLIIQSPSSSCALRASGRPQAPTCVPDSRPKTPPKYLSAPPTPAQDAHRSTTAPHLTASRTPHALVRANAPAPRIQAHAHLARLPRPFAPRGTSRFAFSCVNNASVNAGSSWFSTRCSRPSRNGTAPRKNDQWLLTRPSRRPPEDAPPPPLPPTLL